MSGDIGIHEETIVFYDKTMTETKMVLLKLKGIQLNYHKEESKTEQNKLIDNVQIIVYYIIIIEHQYGKGIYC